MKSRIAAPFFTFLTALVSLGVLLPVSAGAAPVPVESLGSPAVTVEAAVKRAPTAQGWINQMNAKIDLSMNFFIADYGDPGYFNWASDQCSTSPDNFPYNFLWACRRHDFGYRNLKRGESRYGRDMWNRNNKAVVDRQFLRDLNYFCRVDHGNSSACRNAANVYHNYVSSRVAPNTVGLNRDTLV